MDDSKSIINNEFDYSNIVPVIDVVTYLVQYCDQVYKKAYSQRFEVYIREKTYNNITCKDYEEFISAVEGGNLNNIDSMDIKLCMDFRRGRESNLEEHENTFIIKFEPYDITFARKSNYNDQIMNQIEDQINQILQKFPIANSIFCNKESN